MRIADFTTKKVAEDQQLQRSVTTMPMEDGPIFSDCLGGRSSSLCSLANRIRRSVGYVVLARWYWLVWAILIGQKALKNWTEAYKLVSDVCSRRTESFSCKSYSKYYSGSESSHVSPNAFTTRSQRVQNALRLASKVDHGCIQNTKL